MANQKLNSNINLGEIRHLEVPDIINYKLVHDSETQNDGSNRLDEIQYTEVFTVAGAKAREILVS